MKLRLLLCFSLLFPLLTAAQIKLPQSAYIITKQQDTLRGFVNEKSLFEKRVVFFKYRQKDKLYRSYRFDEIKKVVVHPNHIYVPKRVTYKKEERLVLMRVALEGYASVLFTHFDGKDKWYFLERQGKLSQANRKRFGRFASLYFLDCNGWEELHKNVRKYRYRYHRLIKITQDYNRCKQSDPPTRLWIPPDKRGLSYGFRLAMASNKLLLPKASYYENLAPNGWYPGGGLFLTFQTSSRALIRTELNLIQRGAGDEEVNVPPIFREEVRSDFDFNILQAELAVIFQWQLSRNRYKPYLIVGPGIGRNLVADIEETKNCDGVIREGREASLPNDFLISLYGGGGISMPLSKQYRLFIEGRYGLAFTEMESVSVLLDLSLRSFQLGVGVMREL
ncbi:MAG: hypothetical protein AAGG75_27285 [Bacteroidota bacterium]